MASTPQPPQEASPTPPPPQPVWVIMPWLNEPEMTWRAVCDLLAQTVPTRVLLVGQGVSQADRERIDGYIDQGFQYSPEEGPGSPVPRVLCWHHLPTLPSLSATWNRALDFVWELGGEAALVVNNDVRLAPWTIDHLARHLRQADALFVSAVGVRENQFEVYRDRYADHPEELFDPNPVTVEKGGPDFSCFLISRACHAAFRFDEAFVPAYCEDLDYHRRLMLAGEGHRIFSVNLPFLHYASGTLKAMPPAEQQAWAKKLGQSRAHYERKWGGPVNAETFLQPFGQGLYEYPIAEALMATTSLPVTTPDLQAWYRTHPPQPAQP